jgi:hypothetical protein
VARYHGKSGLIYVSTTGTGAAASVGKLSAWTLDMPTDKVETTAFDDTNKTYVQGLKDVSGTLTGFWDDSVDTLFTAGDSADGCKIYLYPASTAITKYWYGPAWLDVSVASGVAAAVTVSANFSANGAWGRK